MSRPPFARGMRSALLAPLILATASLPFLESPLPAIEVVGDTEPEYLARTFRPRWRLAEITDVFREIEHEVERPVQISPRVTEDISRRVLLIERERIPVRRVLELLEETQGLHIVIEPLLVRVLTAEEEKERRRRPVNLDLREYGLFTNAGRSRASVTTQSIDEEYEEALTPFSFGDDHEEFHDLFAWHLDRWIDRPDAVVDVRGTGAILLRLTPEEESSMRTTLEEIADRELARTHWRVSSGFLPGSSETLGGVLPASEVSLLRQSMLELEEFTLSLVSGMTVHVGSGSASLRVGDAEVNQSGVFPVTNPVMRTDRFGRRLRLVARPGLAHTFLDYSFTWTTSVSDATTRRLRVPGATIPGTMGASWNDRKEGSGSVNTWSRPPMISPEVSFALEERAIARYAPEGELCLPRGTGVVIIGELDGRSVAICFEEVTP